MACRQQTGKPLCGRRILVCGKGGSGKSTVVALMAAVLQRNAYEVVVLDGDGSNPEGLVRLLFGLGVEGEPKPLIEFFGGIDVVTCPVDDPSSLTRINDSKPVPAHRIDLFKELPAEYYLQTGGTTLLQAGKIETYGQGCDGPLEKVVRDFMLQGDAVNLIDMKAGIEHFGRKIPDRMDVILGVLDYTYESVSIAKRMAEFCHQGGIRHFWLILNKIASQEIESMIMDKLSDLQDKVIGAISYDQALIKAALSGHALGECMALKEVEHIVERLEQVVPRQQEPKQRRAPAASTNGLA
jgi:CO dehydrogenase maturation factor